MSESSKCDVIAVTVCPTCRTLGQAISTECMASAPGHEVRSGDDGSTYWVRPFPPAGASKEVNVTDMYGLPHNPDDCPHTLCALCVESIERRWRDEAKAARTPSVEPERDARRTDEGCTCGGNDLTAHNVGCPLYHARATPEAP